MSEVAVAGVLASSREVNFVLRSGASVARDVSSSFGWASLAVEGKSRSDLKQVLRFQTPLRWRWP